MGFEQAWDTVPGRGWLHREEAKILHFYAEKAHSVLEIGSYFGRSAHMIVEALRCRNNTMFVAVDPFMDGHHFAADNLSEAEAAEKQVREIVGRMGKWPGDGGNRGEVFKGTEKEFFGVASSFMKFDLVYNDGDHTYEGTRGAIDRWSSRMYGDAIMLLHDYAESGGGVTVRDAIADSKQLKLVYLVERMAVCEVKL